MLPYECLSGLRAFSEIAAGRDEEGPGARDALEILARAASDHVDLIREVDANEAILALVGNTRVTHQAASQLKKDRSRDEKQNKKKKKQVCNVTGAGSSRHPRSPSPAHVLRRHVQFHAIVSPLYPDGKGPSPCPSTNGFT